MTTGLDGFFPGLKNFNTQHFANTCMNSADQPQAFLLGSQTYESRLNPHHYNDYNHSYSDYSNPSNNEPSGAHHSENSRLPYNYRPLSSFYDFVETEYSSPMYIAPDDGPDYGPEQDQKHPSYYSNTRLAPHHPMKNEHPYVVHPQAPSHRPSDVPNTHRPGVQYSHNTPQASFLHDHFREPSVNYHSDHLSRSIHNGGYPSSGTSSNDSQSYAPPMNINSGISPPGYGNGPHTNSPKLPMMSPRGSASPVPHAKPLNNHSHHPTRQSQAQAQIVQSVSARDLCIFYIQDGYCPITNCQFIHDRSAQSLSLFTHSELFYKEPTQTSNCLWSFFVFSTKFARLRQRAKQLTLTPPSHDQILDRFMARSIIIEAHSLLDEMLLEASSCFEWHRNIIPVPPEGAPPSPEFFDELASVVDYITHDEQLLSLPELKKLEQLRTLHKRLINSTVIFPTGQQARKVVTTFESFLRNNTFRNLLDPQVYHSRKPKCQLNYHSSFCRGPVKKHNYHSEKVQKSHDWWNEHCEPLANTPLGHFTKTKSCELSFHCISCHSVILPGLFVNRLYRNRVISVCNTKWHQLEPFGTEWNCPRPIPGIDSDRPGGPSQRARCSRCKAVVGRFYKRTRQFSLIYISQQTGVNFLYWTSPNDEIKRYPGPQEPRFLSFVSDTSLGKSEYRIVKKLRQNPHESYRLDSNTYVACQEVKHLLATDGEFRSLSASLFK